MDLTDIESMEKLRQVFTTEQLAKLADKVLIQHGKAITRRRQQTLEIVINEHGYPRNINGSDNCSMEK